VVADISFSREELGLPPTGFVFCCFNNSFKITAGTFDGWMRILRAIEGSVLWLSEDNAAASGNLRKEASRRGVDARRLIFAGRIPSAAEHLARQRAADLFLDTLPYNAHATASDALWAGVPVLTCLGAAFAGRVAASMLKAVGLPELVTATQAEYEALAIELATNAGRLAQLRGILNTNRRSMPLFDTASYAKDIESAYTRMHERYQTGLSADHMVVTR
jgi:predicted O-linked N-acetylglucosamine transferase (SPINDLY family)